MKPFAVLRTVRSTRRAAQGCIDSLGRPLGGVESEPAPQAFGESDRKDIRGGPNQYPAGNLKPNIYYKPQDFTHGTPWVPGCRGVSRADFYLGKAAGEEGEPVGPEANVRLGTTETSSAPERTAHAGFSFDKPVAWMVEDAACDC
jgi:D-alanine-D-alanine ligase